MARKGVVDRGHGDDLVDHVLTHSAEEPVEVEWAREKRDLAAELEHGDELAVAAHDVKERQRDQARDPRSLRTIDLKDADGVLAGGGEVAVRGHRTLRKARGAARVEDRREVVGLQILDDEGVAVRQGGIWRKREDAPGVVDEVGRLVLGEAGVDGDRDRAG